MAARNRKGQFVKKSRALVVVKRAAPRKRRRTSAPKAVRRRRAASTAMVVASAPRRSTRRRSSLRQGNTTAAKIGIAAVVLGSVAGTATGPVGGRVKELVDKLPGAKTFGSAATAGLYLGATQLIKPGLGGPKISPWLKAAGIVGLVAAGLRVGEAGTSFKWLGDYGSDGYMDVQT